MAWPSVAGWIIGAGVAAAGIAFAVSSALEREGTPAVRSLSLTIAWIALWAGVMRAAGTALPWIVGGIGISAVILAGTLLLPLGTSEPIRAAGPRARVDERDVIFSRAHLPPEAHEAGGASRFHVRALDDEIRRLPALGEPGGLYYDRVNAGAANAIFRWIESVRDLADGEVAPERSPLTPAAAAVRMKGLARALGAPLAGIARLDPADVYSHAGRRPEEYGQPIAIPHGYAIAIGVGMRRPFVRLAPAMPAMVETARAYALCAQIAQLLAAHIRALGWAARAHTDANYRVLCVPIAAEAGLGELSRMGYLIARRFGPRVRLSVVTTNLPMATDAPVSLGARAFCGICRKCAMNCPAGAIPAGDPVPLNGVVKWAIDREACYRYWRRAGTDCGICMRVCPYAKEDGPIHAGVRGLVRRNALARRLALLGDDLLYGRRPRRARIPDWLAGGA